MTPNLDHRTRLPLTNASPSSGLAPGGSPAATLDRAVRRARRRLLPFLLLMYVISFLDRANIGFAKEALQRYAGISPKAYALAAGLFFLSYAAFELPSNLILHRVGARVWMARIMVTWGLVSVATMLVKGNSSFYILRLLLGAAEAGFFPGVILYLTYWFPSAVRARIFGIFYFGAPLAFIFGGPISGLLLQMHPIRSLQNWQWMFLVEGALAVVVGIWSYWYLDNHPEDASWLSASERQALTDALLDEKNQADSHESLGLLGQLRDPRLLLFVLIYCLLQTSVYGVVFYLPSEVSTILHRSAGIEVGLVSAVPWICALAGAFWLPRVADATGLHRGVAALILLAAGCASFLYPVSGPVGSLIALCVAATGLIAVQPLFWTFPTNYLSGRQAAGGVAIINASGAIGGFIAPNIKVWTDEFFHSDHAGLYLLAGVTMLNAGLMVTVQAGRQKTMNTSR